MACLSLWFFLGRFQPKTWFNLHNIKIRFASCSWVEDIAPMCVSCKDGSGTFLFTRVMILLPRYKESWRLIIYRKYHIKSFLFPVRVVTSSFYLH